MNPIPFGPCNLCPLTLIKSILYLEGLKFILAYDCTASTWKYTLSFKVFRYFPISSIGWIVPISLFTCIIVIKLVLGFIEFFNSSIFILPSLSTFKYVTSNPSSSKSFKVFKTDGCSISVDIIWFFLFLYKLETPLIIALLDSVPPDVKYISFSFTPMVLEISCLIAFIFFSTSIPFLCNEEGFA